MLEQTAVSSRSGVSVIDIPSKEEKVMGDKGGKKDKAKKEQQKVAKYTLMEKRKLKKEK